MNAYLYLKIFVALYVLVNRFNSQPDFFGNRPPDVDVLCISFDASDWSIASGKITAVALWLIFPPAGNCIISTIPRSARSAAVPTQMSEWTDPLFRVCSPRNQP